MLSSEVTRLTRNCSDWYPLLDLCGYKECLIADRDGIYDPGTANGRLLLGLKGTISEVELHTLRARLTAGLLKEAERGELALMLPIGLVRDAGGVVVKHPDLRTSEPPRSDLRDLPAGRLGLQGAANPEGPQAHHPAPGPVRRRRLAAPNRRGHPAGAQEPGLCRQLRLRPQPHGPLRAVRPVGLQERLPREQWRIVVKDKYPAYISWATFEKIQAMLRDNHAEYDRNKTRGVPRDGAALLARPRLLRRVRP